MRAARDRVIVAFEHQAPAPSAMHEAVAVLGEGARGAAAARSLLVDSADSSEKRTTDSAVIEPSAPIAGRHRTRRRWIASRPSWIAVAPEAQAVVSEIGDALVPKCFGQPFGDAVFGRFVERR